MKMLDPLKCSCMFICKVRPLLNDPICLYVNDEPLLNVPICLDTNVGPPLNADDFARAAVLPKPNITHEEMHQRVAEGEQKAYVNKPTRNIMAPIK